MGSAFVLIILASSKCIGHKSAYYVLTGTSSPHEDLQSASVQVKGTCWKQAKRAELDGQ